MTKIQKIKELAKQLVDTLKNLPVEFEIETGIELMHITRLFVKIHLLRKKICQTDGKNGKNKNRKKVYRRLRGNSKSRFKRNKT